MSGCYIGNKVLMSEDNTFRNACRAARITKKETIFLSDKKL